MSSPPSSLPPGSRRVPAGSRAPSDSSGTAGTREGTNRQRSARRRYSWGNFAWGTRERFGWRSAPIALAGNGSRQRSSGPGEQWVGPREVAHAEGRVQRAEEALESARVQRVESVGHPLQEDAEGLPALGVLLEQIHQSLANTVRVRLGQRFGDREARRGHSGAEGLRLLEVRERLLGRFAGALALVRVPQAQRVLGLDLAREAEPRALARRLGGVGGLREHGARVVQLVRVH